MVIGLFVILELISNNVVEPLLYGSGTGISSVAVLLAAVFWTWLWGMPGLVLATPLTVCIVVLGRHLPHMHWLAVLLGDEPALPPPAKVYQRLLAMDHEETFEFAQDQLKAHTLAEFYDEVLVPALNLSERDRHAGTLDAGQCQLELWDSYGRRSNTNLAHVGPACGVGVVELGLNMDAVRGGAKADLLGPQAKWTFFGREANAPLSAAVSAGGQKDVRGGGRCTEPTSPPWRAAANSSWASTGAQWRLSPTSWCLSCAPRSRCGPGCSLRTTLAWGRQPKPA